MERSRFDISLSTSAYMPRSETRDRGRELRFAASPLTPQPDRPVRIISMAVPDQASPIASRNHSLARTTVASSSQTRTRATMLALTSHYSATNTKHPRHAPAHARARLPGLGGNTDRPALCGPRTPEAGRGWETDPGGLGGGPRAGHDRRSCQYSQLFRHPRPEPNTLRKRLTWYG